MSDPPWPRADRHTPPKMVVAHATVPLFRGSGQAATSGRQDTPPEQSPQPLVEQGLVAGGELRPVVANGSTRCGIAPEGGNTPPGALFPSLFPPAGSCRADQGREMKILTRQGMAFEPPLLTGDRLGQTGRHRDIHDPVTVHEPSFAQGPKTGRSKRATGSPKARSFGRRGHIRGLIEPPELFATCGCRGVASSSRNAADTRQRSRL